MYKHATKFINSENKPELTRVPSKTDFEWAMLDRAVEMIAAQRLVEELKVRARTLRQMVSSIGQRVSLDSLVDEVLMLPPLESIAIVRRADVRRLTKSRLDKCLVGSAREHRRYTAVANRAQHIFDEMRTTAAHLSLSLNTKAEVVRLLDHERVLNEIVMDIRSRLGK